MFCIKCGKELESDQKICPNCGVPVNDRQTENKPPGYTQKNRSRSLYREWWFWVSMSIVIVLGLGVMTLRSFYNKSEGVSSETQDIEGTEDVNESSNITDEPLEENFVEMDPADQEDGIEEPFEDIEEYPTDEGSDAPVWSKEYLFWYTQGLHDRQVTSYIKLAKNLLERAGQLNNDTYLKTDWGLFQKEYFEITRDRSDLLYAGEIKDNKPAGFGVLSKQYQLEIEEYNEYGEYETVPLYFPIYIGEFSEGRYNGRGMSYIDRSESVSLSDVRADDVDILEYAEQYFHSISYIGDFSNGERSGDGVLFSYPSLAFSSYEGWEEADDEFDLSNISVTLGQFKNDELNGVGKIYNKQYILYEGDFANGRFNGTGIQYFPESTKIQYKGEFKTGKYNGTGTLYDENGGIIYEGKWEFGDYSD